MVDLPRTLSMPLRLAVAILCGVSASFATPALKHRGEPSEMQLTFQTTTSDLTVTVPLDNNTYPITELQCDRQDCKNIEVTAIIDVSLPAMHFICTVYTDPKNYLGEIVGAGWQITPPATITDVVCANNPWPDKLV
ncbi:uncharacterized protein PV07_12636 [Cladophialophora immunda]|uniref:AA1-like domain-containing protein n=1 Tax=Cladophialophora immunda TaxID=569365 RepID=A0A0D2BU76_9EURO|nr:uncharacterized protein PV07_12636 [Cladophialophora immunda]KIW21960.1 hypothetical protein PV07_12636 [Cladophialophora immunda]